MKNNRVIIVNGIQRGGTNIVWNIIQSHPAVVSAMRETGKILYQSKLSAKGWAVIRKNNFLMKMVVVLAGNQLDKLFYDYKMKSLDHEDDRYKLDGILYLPHEVAESMLCLKSVNNDIWLNKLFAFLYKDCYFIGVVRNGYAMCESWVRRGISAKDAGIAYRKYTKRILEDSKYYENYYIVKFEDILNDPFASAKNIYKKLALDPIEIPKLRFKSKRVLSVSGSHDAAFGEVEHKYWFSKENIRDIIKGDIDEIQCDKLSLADKEAFEKEAGSILVALGYK